MFIAILARVRALLQRPRVARELDDELQFHVAMETEADIKKGMPPTEARRTALRDLGGIEQTKETIRTSGRSRASGSSRGSRSRIVKRAGVYQSLPAEWG